MIEDRNATINPDEDERWTRVMKRFDLLETQLEELYWDVLSLTSEDGHQSISNQSKNSHRS